jgi:YD repeat-containing protein
MACAMPFVSACTGPSRARLALIEYTPDDTTEEKVETIFTYFDSGFIDKIEREVGGDEVSEILYYFDDMDRLKIIEHKYKGDGDFSYVLDTNISYNDEGRASAVTLDGSWSWTQDVNGTSVNYEYVWDDGTEYSYDESGRSLASEKDNTTLLTYAYEESGEEYQGRSETNITGETKYTWTNDGLLSKIVYEADENESSSTNGVDGDNSRSVIESQSDINYLDGTVNEIESEETITSGDDFTRTINEYSTDFNEDGKLTQIERTSETNNIETDSELEITYDDEGRISAIEDRDGNEWEFEYEGTEPTKGVTFHSRLLPLFIDLEGKQVMEAVGLVEHLSF